MVRCYWYTIHVYCTITGLESLVQKEWVTTGHTFTSRRGLVTEDSTEDDEGKVSYYTLSPVVVTEFAVTFSERISLLKYSLLITCFFMAYNPYIWLDKCPALLQIMWTILAKLFCGERSENMLHW